LREAQAGYDLAVAGELAARLSLHVAKAALREIIGKADLRLTPLREELPLQEPVPVSLDDRNPFTKCRTRKPLARRMRRIVCFPIFWPKFRGLAPRATPYGNEAGTLQVQCDARRNRP
jgi:hypothetical protein